MRRLSSRIWPWSALLIVAFCVLVQPAFASTIADPGRFLDQAENLRTSDHPRFVQMLAQIHREGPQLTPAEQWHLRYLDAWETMYEGNYTKSATQLREVIDHSGVPVLATKASALLLSNLSINRHYKEAFELANRLTRELPEVRDAEARFTLLYFLSMTMTSAGQTDLAIQYARMMESALPAGETLCKPLHLQVDALEYGKRLNSASHELQDAIAACVAARQPVLINSLQLIQAHVYLRDGQPRAALALLGRIAHDIQHSGYQPHMLWWQMNRAMAYAKLGNDSEAKKAALAVLAMSRPGDKNGALRDTYKVLYQIEKNQGHAAAALDYYEKYAALDKANLDDVSARAMAYETVQQHVLVQKLETEQLNQQNAALRMQQKLDAKAAETNRLYLALLLMALVFAGLWMFRIKRSQLRFKKLSHLDGLTTVFNRQHFMGEVERTLHLLEKRAGTACLVFIDLDHFKRINDTHGHAMGDEVLRQVVVAGRQQLRPADLFGRLGGEEFGILLVGCSHEQGMAIADRIRCAIEATTVECEGAAIAISTSVGLACTGAHGYDLRRLCREADSALYRAKRGGRNRVEAGAEDSMPIAI
ncbi:diguanylate cyclase [Rhodanobacter sp. C06]|uniref:sensor domain-containing diguanylate cyclase n=1 Tax=Rhodanobacter sp. C06 TaxID=1945854 RepID=UPI0020C36930|nr:diguanylate cyclase [Rhodanobacter sp. C06]